MTKWSFNYSTTGISS